MESNEVTLERFFRVVQQGGDYVQVSERHGKTFVQGFSKGGAVYAMMDLSKEAASHLIDALGEFLE